MDIHTIAAFFAWCTVINGALLSLWILAQMAVPDLVYKTQQKWFPIDRKTFDVVFYCMLGFYKFIFLIFNLVPYIALRIIIGSAGAS